MTRAGTTFALLAAGAVLAVAGGAIATTGGQQRRGHAQGARRMPAPRPATSEVWTLRHRSIGGLDAAADGSVRVIATDANDTDSPATDFHADVQELSASGRRLRRRPLPLPSRGFVIGGVATALTPDGAIVAYTEAEDGRTGAVHVVSSDRGGAVLADDTLPLGPHPHVSSALTGPTGAAVVRGVQDSPDPQLEQQPTWLAFRPAGATHFGAPFELATAADGLTTLDVVLGPDGGGWALGTPVAEPGAFVRRISPQGFLGPRMPFALPAGLSVTAVGAVDASGTLVTALTTSPFKRPKQGATSPRDGLYVSTIAPSATAPTVPSKVARNAVRGASVYPTIAVGEGGYAMVGAPQGRDAFALYEGVHGELRPTALPPVRRSATPVALLAADGAATVIWASEIETPDREGRRRVLGMHRRAGGRFGRPQVISDPKRDVLLDGAELLPNGNVAVAYRDLDSATSTVAIVRSLR